MGKPYFVVYALRQALADIAVEIPKRCHAVNRVVYAFGDRVTETHFTTATPTVLSRDNVAMLQVGQLDT